MRNVRDARSDLGKRLRCFSILARGLFATLAVPLFAHAQLDFERAPINYSSSTPTNAITRLDESLTAGDRTLNFESAHGYLKALLHELDVPVSSQVLVFSKTSFQRHRISRRTPRALYFNDETYVGWVQRGDVIEISAADPNLGAVFYTLDQDSAPERPLIQRQADHCLICHASTHTRRVPGHIVRSVYPDRSGMPVFSQGTFRTDHTSPFRERWGGWYVTGTHGALRHMGNETVTGRDGQLDTGIGANVTDLQERLDTTPYLSPHSDIVALMVLEHQTAMHNCLTAGNFAGQFALRDARVMNEAMDREEDFESDSTRRRFDNAAQKIVECLLFVDEFKLTDSVCGTSSFATEFSARGPRDHQGRSLRQFDLSNRLFRYPCSYLIYSEAFNALPQAIRDRVYQKLWGVLTGTEDSEQFAHLTENDRDAIREILVETREGLPDYWRNSHSELIRNSSPP